MGEVVIYAVVGASLGLIIIILVGYLVFRKCRSKLHFRKRMEAVNEHETVSINSATSKDMLLYGSRDSSAFVPGSKMDSGSVAVTMESQPPQSREDSSSDERRSSRSSIASCARDTIPESVVPPDTATRFLQRRQSSSSIDAPKIGAIQPDLYRKRGSILTQSVVDSSKAYGKVQLKLQYDYSKSDFVVTVMDAQDLPPFVSEYYFKVDVKPGIDGKNRHTISRKKSMKTAFKEQQFKFPLTLEDVMERKLVIQLFDAGRVGRIPTMVGETELDLQELDPSAQIEVWADIVAKSQKDQFGDLLFSLHYLPSAERLTVTIHQAKGLKKMDIAGTSDPYVKVVILRDGKLVKKRNTAIKKNTLSPIWNEALSFTISEKSLRDSRLELIVKDHDRVGHNETIGLVELHNEVTEPKAKRLWDDLLQGKSIPPTWFTLQYCSTETRRNSD